MTDLSLVGDRSWNAPADGFQRPAFAALGEGVAATSSVTNHRRRRVDISCS